MLTAPDLERDHAPEALHLLGKRQVAGVTRKTRIVNGGDLAVTKKELDDLLGVVAAAVHAHAEGLQAAKHQPCVERAGNRAHGVLVEGNALLSVLEPRNRNGFCLLY